MKYVSILAGVTLVEAFAPYQPTSFVFHSNGNAALYSEDMGSGGSDYADGGDELGFNEPNPYADQYDSEYELVSVSDEMKEVMSSLDYGSISSEGGYVAAAKKRAEEARKKLVEDEEKGFSSGGSSATPEYKSSILLSDGAQKQVDSNEPAELEQTGGVKEAAKSDNNADILFVDGDDDDGSLLVF